MNNIQKERIEKMRLQGYSYSKISIASGISENTIKSYCRRNNLGGIRNLSKQENINNESCKRCGKELIQEKRGQPKKFCSDKCRREWWKENNNSINRKAYYKILCVYCGESFSSYGNKNRKFCSHSCYINTRFKVGNN